MINIKVAFHTHGKNDFSVCNFDLGGGFFRYLQWGKIATLTVTADTFAQV